MTYSDRKEGLTNNVGRIDAVDNDDTEMTDKKVYESVCVIT